VAGLAVKFAEPRLAARPTRMAAGCMGVRFLRADGVGRG